jgi:hypothetical protein
MEQTKTKTHARYLHEVVELTRKCDLGEQGERAVVLSLEKWNRSMDRVELMFFNRPEGYRKVYTGADYRFLKEVK